MKKSPDKTSPLDLKTRLVDQRTALAARCQAIAGERAKIALAAHAGNDPAARDQLNALNLEAAQGTLEMETLDIAIEEAEGLILADVRERQAEERRESARKARLHLDEAMRHATAMDAAVRGLVESNRAFIQAMREIELLRMGPNMALVRVNLVRALKSAFMGSSIEMGIIPPGHRHSVSELAEGWQKHINLSTGRALGEIAEQPAPPIADDDDGVLVLLPDPDPVHASEAA